MRGLKRPPWLTEVGKYMDGTYLNINLLYKYLAAELHKGVELLCGSLAPVDDVHHVGGEDKRHAVPPVTFGIFHNKAVKRLFMACLLWLLLYYSLNISERYRYLLVQTVMHKEYVMLG